MSFDEQPDGDIHSDSTTEIHRLVEELRIQSEHFERAWKVRGDRIDHLQSQLDACRPYLKEGETAADALERLSNHSNSSGLSWNGHNIYGDADSIKEARDAIEYKASRFAAFAAKLWPDEDIDAPTTKETT